MFSQMHPGASGQGRSSGPRFSLYRNAQILQIDGKPYASTLRGNIYQFRVFIKRVKHLQYFASRDIELFGSTSLLDLAAFIVYSYDYGLFKHFTFCDNILGLSYSNEIYSSFSDVKEELAVTPLDMGVKFTHIYEVFYPSKLMFLIFDHGEVYDFVLDCLNITYPVNGVRYPRISRVDGKAPPQYHRPD